VPYLNASAVVIHYEEALYQVYAPFFTFTSTVRIFADISEVFVNEFLRIFRGEMSH